MANLEVQIGADKSEFDKKIKEVEFDIQELAKEKAIQIKAGLDTSEITKNIKSAKQALADLKTTLKDTGNAFQGATKPMANAGNTLTNFSRIAQDAPFGIMGIGNNLTATAEAFAGLSKNAGGAGNALKAVGASLMGGGGILLAISLVTTGLTIMSQQGITVADVFSKLTGTFDGFKKALGDVNAESAKQSGSEIAMMKAYVNEAQDETQSRENRLIAVKKLQQEYPAYFGNLTKEQILNGDVTKSVKELTIALIAKAKATAFASKIGDLASKEVPLRAKEADLIAKGNAKIKERNDLLKRIGDEKGNERLANQWVRAGQAVAGFNDDLADTQKEIRGLHNETDRWQKELNKVVQIDIKTEFDPDAIKKAKIKKPKKIKVSKEQFKNDDLELAAERKRAMDLILNEDTPLPFITPAADEKFKALLESLKKFNEEAKALIQGSITETFGSLGNAIGSALANGTSVAQAMGASLLNSMGAILSQIGDKLIALGAAAIVSGTLATTMFTPAGVAGGIAAIAIGTALKAGGGFLGGKANQLSGKSGGSNNSVQAGNSVSTPTSSVSSMGGGGGFSNVVFEISGQSLVGVLSNTLNKNVKLGGVPAI